MNILIAGVGGQGTLLASRVLGHVAVKQGYDVKVSEVHGMAQRGGSVVTYVKFGEKVYSPIIEDGEADIVLAFEELEACRYLPALKKGGKLLCSRQCIDPMPVITGAMQYPGAIPEKMKAAGVDIIMVEAYRLAKEAGSEKVVNVVLIGALAALMHLDKEIWLTSIRETVPPKFLEINCKAFTLGYESVAK